MISGLCWIQTSMPSDQIGAMNNQFLDYLKLILILAAILILAYLSIRYWIPRIMGFSTYSSGPIQMVSRFPLEPRKALYVIKAGQEYFLIGTSDSEMRCLASLDAAGMEPYLVSGEPRQTAPGSFSRLLKNLRTPRDS